jgi:protein phosphatase
MVPPAAGIGPFLEVAQRTDPGCDPAKQINEDACGHLCTPLGHLLVVCDGMGGHTLGQRASQLAVHTILCALERAPEAVPRGAALKDAIARAGRAVHELGGNQPLANRPGATCVALLVHAGGTEVAHVGDSRAYLVRGAQIWQLTRDHSVVEQLIARGALAPEQARGHPEANVITRALGMRADVEVECKESPVAHESGDTFLLASDGLSDVTLPEELCAIVGSSPTLEVACDTLVELANARGGPDNVTVLLARVKAEPGREATVPDAPPRTVLSAPAMTLVELPASPTPTLIERGPATRTAPGDTRSPFAFFSHDERDDRAESVKRAQRRTVLLFALGALGVLLVLGAVVLWWLLALPR